MMVKHPPLHCLSYFTKPWSHLDLKVKKTFTCVCVCSINQIMVCVSWREIKIFNIKIHRETCLMFLLLFSSVGEKSRGWLCH